MLRLEGAAERLKSGGVEPVTVNRTFTEWERLPFAPKTVTLPEPPLAPAEIESVAVAVPFGLRDTLVGLIDQVLHAGQSGGGEVERETVPLKPFTLFRIIVDVPVVPAGMLRLLGFAVMAKSGLGFDWTTTKEIVTL